jgi:hypothetical protein
MMRILDAFAFEKKTRAETRWEQKNLVPRRKALAAGLAQRVLAFSIVARPKGRG